MSLTPTTKKSIGKLKLFDEDLVGTGRFGHVFKGMFEANLAAVMKISLAQKSWITETEHRLVDLIKDCPENLARYLHQERDAHFLYIAVELCAGTLEDLVSGILAVPIPSPSEEILRQITTGLEYLHSKQIVHRDVKPSHVHVSSEGIVKLANFGLNKKKTDNVTADPGYVDVEEWSAPELVNNPERFDTSTDIFSLGCVFAFSLTGGKHPFGEAVNQKANIIAGRVNDDVMLAIENEKLRHLAHSMISHESHRRPKLEQIRLKLLELLAFYYDSLGNKKNEFTRTVNEATQVLTALDCDAVGEECGGSLLKIFKSSSKNKFESAIKILSSLDSDVNETDEDNRNALTFLLEKEVAAEETERVLIVANLLIARKINVNEKTNNGFTALGLAIKNCSPLSLVELLLDNGADPNIQGSSGWNAVNLACRYYQKNNLIDLLKLLLKKGARVEHRTPSGNNALTLLVLNYQHDNLADVMDVLIEAGIDVNSKSNKNWNALHMLCCHYKSAEGLFPAVRLLVEKGINIREQTQDEHLTVLHLMMVRRFGNTERLAELANYLLEHGAEADVVDRNGWTPLLLACQFYHQDDFIPLVDCLIKHGANPNCRLGSNGENALTLAVTHRPHQENLTDVLELFLDNGADVNSKSIFNWNALMKLFRYCRRDEELFPALKLLVRRGINVNERDKKRDWNALHILAMHFGNERNESLSDIVKFLLDNGAQADNVGQDGWTPLLLACQYYQKDDFADVIELLIEREAKPNRKLANGNNALTLTALFQTHQKNIARVLLHLIMDGADVHCKDGANWNALMMVCRFFVGLTGYADAVKVLVTNGANVNERLAAGWTALHLAAKFFGDHRNEYLSDVVKCLIDKGADRFARTQDGSTPLQLASQCYHCQDLPYVIKMLNGGSSEGLRLTGHYPLAIEYV